MIMSSLMQAIAAGHLEQVKALIDSGADVNASDENGRTPLMQAAAAGRKDMVRLLVRAKAAVNAIDAQGNTALMYAARNNQPQVFEYLFALTTAAEQQRAQQVLNSRATAQAQLQKQFREQGDEFVAAAARGDLATVEQFLSAQIDVNVLGKAKLYQGKSALYLAARNGHRDMLQVLINAGADLNVQVKKDDIWAGKERPCPKCSTRFTSVQDRGECPNCWHVFYASQPSYDPNAKQSSPWDQAIVKQDEPGIRVTTIPPRAIQDHTPKMPPQAWHNYTPLMAAIRQGYADVVQLLLEAGAEPKTTHWKRQTPMMMAIEFEQPAVVKILIQLGAEVNAQDADGLTALIMAAEQGNLTLIDRLLQAGADVNLAANASFFGSATRTALAVAIEHDYQEIIERLQAAEATQPGAEAIALVAAAEQGDLARVQRLLDAGVAPDIEEPVQKRRALLKAAFKGHPEVVQALLAAGANPDGFGRQTFQPITAAAYYGHVDIVRLLIAAGANVNIIAMQSTALDFAEQYQYTEMIEVLRSAGAGEFVTLYQAIENGDLARVRELIASGVDLDLGDPPLAIAVATGHVEIVQALLDAGVNPDSGWDTTPLEEAVCEGHLEIVLMLLEAGANPNIRLEDGYTALIQAAASGNIDIVRALIQADADVNARSHHGGTPLESARSNHHSDIVKLLQDADAKDSPFEDH